MSGGGPHAAARPEYWEAVDPALTRVGVEVSHLRTADERWLYRYQAGDPDAPALILVSPGESPFLLMSRLFEQLARHFRVTAWDDAASPFLRWDEALPLPTIDILSQDLRLLMEADRMQRPHIVTWCAGAMVLLWAQAVDPVELGSATLVAPPSVLGHGAARTGFQTHFLQLVMQLGSGPRSDERALYERIRSIPKSLAPSCDVDRAILELTSLPMRDFAATKRYARLIHYMCTHAPRAAEGARELPYPELFDSLCARARVALVHCQDDDVVSCESSAEMASRHGDVRFVVYPDGGHFVIFREPERLAHDVLRFIQEPTNRRERMRLPFQRYR